MLRIGQSAAIVAPEERPLSVQEFFITNLLRELSIDNLLTTGGGREKEFFIANLLVRIHLIVDIISVDRPCAKGV